MLESGDFEGFLPARIRNMDTSTPEYESARSDTLEVRYEYFIDRFNDYLNEIRKDSPPYADISFLKETTHKVFKKVFLKQSPKEAFANNDELTRYKELLTKYLFDNFHVALAKATEDYSIHKLTDDEIDKLLEGVTKPRE